MRKSIKSVHITNYYHENSGGVRTNYDRLLNEANRHRREVVLIVPGAENKSEAVGRFGKIYFVKAGNSPVFDKRYRLMTPFHYVLNGSAIREILLAEMPDMIEIYDNYSLTLLAGIIRMGKFKCVMRPMLVYFTGERFDTIFQSFVARGRFGKWFPKTLMSHFNLPMFDYYIANSEFVADELRMAMSGIADESQKRGALGASWKFFNGSATPVEQRIRVCQRGVDTSLFNPAKRDPGFRAKIAADAGFPLDSKMILVATRLSPEKNVAVLSPLMEGLQKSDAGDFRLVVAGGGPKAEWLVSEAQAKFPGKLFMAGHLDKETLARYYSNCDVFLHPNPREPFGNVGLEALASGAACVFPNAGGVLEYANGENSWLADPAPEGFAAAIGKAVSDDRGRDAKLAAAEATARANSQEAAVARLFETYDRLYSEFWPEREAFNNKVKTAQLDFARSSS